MRSAYFLAIGLGALVLTVACEDGGTASGGQTGDTGGDSSAGPGDSGPGGETSDVPWDSGEGADAGPGGDSEADAPEPSPCKDLEPCDDLDPCTAGDTCEDGVCAGEPYSCDDDGNDCTIEACDGTGGCTVAISPGHCFIDGTCVDDGAAHPRTPCFGCVVPASQSEWSANDELSCSDGDACTAGDRCFQGVCVTNGAKVDCDDANPCTLDGCEPATGCTHAAQAGACSDGDPCTVGDSCTRGACAAGSGALVCSDGNPCTDDACTAGQGCVFTANGASCSDGNACTLGDRCIGKTCEGGATALVCSDGSPCTDDECDPFLGCTFPANAAPCSDGNACTFGDTCSGGGCFPAGPTVCDDANPCTDDGCLPASGCVFVPNTLPCDDGSVCTQGDFCELGACQPGATPLPCDDGNPCTDDTCDPVSGCVHTNNTAPCNDGLACTLADTCGAGSCKGTPKVCNDGNACTNDFCDSATGACDSQAISNTFDCIPVIVLTKPARAATITGSASVQVQGTVSSGGGSIAELVVNGVTIPTPGGVFATTLAAKHGMNLITVTAVDAIGNENSLVQSFYYSTLFTPTNANNPAASFITDGLALWLGKSVIDDGNHSPTNVNDLATVVEIVAQSFNIGGLLTNPVATVSGVKIDVTSLTHGKPTVSLAPIAGALDAKFTLPNLDAKLKFTYQVCIIGCFNVTASGSAKASSVVVDTDLVISVTAQTGKVNVTLGATDVAVNNLDVSLDGVIGFLTNWIINFFEGSFADSLEAAFKSQLGSALPAIVADAFQSIALNESFSIDPLVEGASPVTVSLQSSLSSAVFNPNGGVLGLRATATAPKDQALTSLGAIRRNGCGTGTEAIPAFSTQWPLQLGLHDDVLNQILYGIWWGGGLAFPVGSDLIGGVALPGGISNLSLNVEFLLPPIAVSCGTGGQLRVQVGDIRVDASLNIGPLPVSLEIFASLDALASVSVVDGPEGKELGLSITTIDVLVTDLEYDDDALLSVEGALQSLIEAELVPTLLDSLTGGALAGFPLPAIDLSSISGVPPGTALELDLTNVVRSGGYTVLRGNVK